MQKKIFMLLAVLVVLFLAGCGNHDQTKTGADIPFAADPAMEPTKTDDAVQVEADSIVMENTEKAGVLIVYFSRTGNTDFPEDVDAVTSASLLAKDEAIYGNTQYIAALIQQATGGQVFLIEVQEKYPADYDDTVDRAEKEGNEGARPQLVSKIDDLDDYETVFLGFPNWWYDMPMAVYSFLDEYDLSGKTVIPFVTSGGSGFSDAISTIQEMEPEADVITDGFKTTHSRVDGVSFEDVEEWINGLGIVGLE